MSPSDIDTAERIVRLETKLDFIIVTLNQLPVTLDTRATAIELRLTRLERWRNQAIGALMILNILLVVAMDKLRAMFFPT